MSFILDALKKSEADRQRDASPGIADVPVGSRSSPAPRWLGVVAALLAVNLIALIVILLRPWADDRGKTVALSNPAPAAAVEAAAPAVATTAGNREALPPPEPERPARLPVQTAPQTTPADTAAEPPAPPPQPQSTAEPETAPAEPAGGSDEAWLTLNELRASGAVDLPEMHIDLHVYSPNPAERFVFIDMNEYRENAVLDNGSRIRRITPDGVILDYRGTRILLPRE